MNDVFDPESVLPAIGGEVELLKELIEIFQSIYPEDLEMIEKALRNGDLDELRKSAHRMKGSVANFGKKKAFEAAKDLEEAAKLKEAEKVNKLFEELKRQVIDLNNALIIYCEQDS